MTLRKKSISDPSCLVSANAQSRRTVPLLENANLTTAGSKKSGRIFPLDTNPPSSGLRLWLKEKSSTLLPLSKLNALAREGRLDARPVELECAC